MDLLYIRESCAASRRNGSGRGLATLDRSAPSCNQSRSPPEPTSTPPGAASMSTPLHPLAQAANDALAKDCPQVLAMLSARGKRFFFPAKGILAQSAEAKQKAKTANATIGIATEGGAPMHLACVGKYFNGLAPGEIFDYAPSYGKPDVRTAWAKKQREETPSLAGHPLSNPVVTNALTHGLGLVGDLFLDPGDAVLTPDLLWENYNLNWETRLEATFHYFQFFDAKLTGFNLPAFTEAL